MDFSNIFNVFSRRPRPANEKSTPLTPEFRSRVFLLWIRTFPRGDSGSWASVRSGLWSDVYDKLLYSLGRPRLSNRHTLTLDGDLNNFVDECSDEHFLDFIEFSFQSQAVFECDVPVGDLISAINSFFQEDSLPFFLTEFTVVESQGGVRLEGYPRIIRRDSEVLHQTALEPALVLLRGSDFGETNKEFLRALTDYRKGDYGDCVTKCGSALESVMKIICERKGWPTQRNASKLLNTVLSNTDLPEFLKQPLNQVAVIRNELGSAHGAGTQPREVSRHLAQYAINVTASAILLLVEDTNP